MQDPNADTQWNDALRSKGIIPPKEKEVSEDDIVKIMEATIKQKAQGKELEDMTLDELDEKVDDIDEEEERLFEEYRRQRMQEMKQAQLAARYGDVLEISKEDYVREVNKAGEGIWVIVHVYKNSIPLCKMINEYMYQLARQFPQTKFIKSVSSVCIPNYPDKNLPTIFVYYESEMKKQFVGPLSFGGMNLKVQSLEWMLSETGAIKTTLEENPCKPVHDVMSSSIKNVNYGADSDDSD